MESFGAFSSACDTIAGRIRTICAAPPFAIWCGRVCRRRVAIKMTGQSNGQRVPPQRYQTFEAWVGMAIGASAIIAIGQLWWRGVRR